MSDLVLHNYDLDENCYKVRLALSLMGIEARLIAVNAFPGKEHLSPTYLALNPLGTLPILQDDELVLCGAEAILLHLADRAGGDWTALSAAEKGRAMQWLFFAAGPLSVASQARANALFGENGNETALRAEAKRMLRVMDDHVTMQAAQGASWFCADRPTTADIALFPAFALSRDFGIDHDEFPALRLWARRLRKLPGFISMPGIPDYH